MYSFSMNERSKQKVPLIQNVWRWMGNWIKGKSNIIKKSWEHKYTHWIPMVDVHMVNMTTENIFLPECDIHDGDMENCSKKKEKKVSGLFDSTK